MSACAISLSPGSSPQTPGISGDSIGLNGAWYSSFAELLQGTGPAQGPKHETLCADAYAAPSLMRHQQLGPRPAADTPAHCALGHPETETLTPNPSPNILNPECETAQPHPRNLAGPIVPHFIVAQVQLPQLVVVPLPQRVGQRDSACEHIGASGPAHGAAHPHTRPGCQSGLQRRPTTTPGLQASEAGLALLLLRSHACLMRCGRQALFDGTRERERERERESVCPAKPDCWQGRASGHGST